jgi:hypothetical protein
MTSLLQQMPPTNLGPEAGGGAGSSPVNPIEGQNSTSTVTPTTTTTITTTAKPGLPSPSTSETSDYQRSTPSPSSNDQNLRIGTRNLLKLNHATFSEISQPLT